MKKFIFILIVSILACTKANAAACVKTVAINNQTACTIYIRIDMVSSLCTGTYTVSNWVSVAAGTSFYWVACGNSPSLSWSNGVPNTSYFVIAIRAETDPSNPTSCPIASFNMGETSCGLPATGSMNPTQNAGCGYTSCSTINGNYNTTITTVSGVQYYYTVANYY